jgi:hypothetical protein
MMNAAVLFASAKYLILSYILLTSISCKYNTDTAQALWVVLQGV